MNIFMMKKNLVLSAIVIVMTTAIYSFFLYQAEKIDRTVIFERVKSAYDDGQLLLSPIPLYSYGLGSRNNLSGLDQMGESFYALMFLYKDAERPWLNSLNPGYYRTIEEIGSTTLMAQRCATSTQQQLADSSVWKIAYKPRFWHGVKAVILPALQYIQLAQISWIITISTFFMFAVILSLVMFLEKKTGLAYMAFTLPAFYCSSVLFFGGIAYSTPLLSTAFWGALWLAYRALPWNLGRHVELMLITFGGTLLCFFYQLGGEEIYAMSFIFFVEFFLPQDNFQLSSSKKAFQSAFYFLLGFFGSIILKHVLIVMVSGSLDAVYELFHNILYRASSTNDAGTKIGVFDIVLAQFHWYGIAGYGIDTVFKIVNNSLPLSIVLVVVLIVWILLLKIRNQYEKCVELSVYFLGFILMLAVVLLRYMVLRNHSDIHLFFVSRYLFVYAGTVYFFTGWLLLHFRYFLPVKPEKVSVAAHHFSVANAAVAH